MFITCIIRLYGQSFLQDIISPIITSFISENRMDIPSPSPSPSPSLSPLPSDEDRIHYEGSIKTAIEIIEAVERSLPHCPPIIKKILNIVYELTSKKFPGNELKVMTSLLFLRFISPGILSSPLLDNDQERRRKFVKVTKVLQLMVNHISTSNESWISSFPSFPLLVAQYKDKIDFLLSSFAVPLPLPLLSILFLF